MHWPPGAEFRDYQTQDRNTSSGRRNQASSGWTSDVLRGRILLSQMRYSWCLSREGRHHGPIRQGSGLERPITGGPRAHPCRTSSLRFPYRKAPCGFPSESLGRIFIYSQHSTKEAGRPILGLEALHHPPLPPLPNHCFITAPISSKHSQLAHRLFQRSRI